MMRRSFVVLLSSSLLSSAEGIQEGERLFVEKIQPLFAEKCMACHGDKPDKLKGEFDMRTREGMLKGGESGDPGLVPGKPEESWIYIGVTWEDSLLEMPPKANDRLSAEQVADVRRWIELGAPWGGKDIVAREDPNTITIKTSGGTSDSWTNRRYQKEDVWAWQPVQKPAVPKIAGVSHPVDAFIRRKLGEVGLEPAPRADRQTFLRRASYGLTGMPPSHAVEEMFERSSCHDLTP